VTKVVWHFLWTIATVCTTVLILDVAIASESIVTKGLGENQPMQPTLANREILDLLVEYSQTEITSVSQLSEVKVTDWAFQRAIYNCITGDRDRTFQENRALTRYEFAVKLNACLNRMGELMARRSVAISTDEKLRILRRLQKAFATLRDRVDPLESRTTQLEANRFSTTTKLNGEAIFSVAGVLNEDKNLDTDNDGVADTTPNSQITFSSQVQLELNASFTTEDELSVEFEASNGNDFASDPIGFSFSGNTEDKLVLSQLSYTFPVGDRVEISIGASGIGLDDFVTSTISPFDDSDDDGGSGSLSDFGFPRQYSLDPGDLGIGASIQLTDNLILDFGYSAGEGNEPEVGAGLFNGDYAAIAQLTFLSDFFDATITYVNAYSTDGFITEGSEVANVYGTQANFRPFDGVEIGGGLAYVSTTQIGVQNAHAWSYQLTLAVRIQVG
jgi:Carbohydrate-selective porin, OprB family